MKYIIMIPLLLFYIDTLGMFTIKVKFPDNTSFILKGWMLD